MLPYSHQWRTLAFLLLVAGTCVWPARAGCEYKWKAKNTSFKLTICWNGIWSADAVANYEWHVYKVKGYFTGVFGSDEIDLRQDGYPFAMMTPSLTSMRRMEMTGSVSKFFMDDLDMFAKALTLLCNGKAVTGLLIGQNNPFLAEQSAFEQKRGQTCPPPPSSMAGLQEVLAPGGFKGGGVFNVTGLAVVQERPVCECPQSAPTLP